MGKLFFAVFFALAMVGFTSGCAAKKKLTDGQGTELTEAQLAAEREARFGEGSIPTAEGGGLFKDIRFDYDSGVVGPDERLSVESNARTLKSRPELSVTIEGHCDERGTAEYNMALGNTRARAVRALLISYGVAASRIQTISYGEEVPLDLGHGEDSWARNRRAHFSAMGSGGSGAGQN